MKIKKIYKKIKNNGFDYDFIILFLLFGIICLFVNYNWFEKLIFILMVVFVLTKGEILLQNEV